MESTSLDVRIPESKLGKLLSEYAGYSYNNPVPMPFREWLGFILLKQFEDKNDND